MQQQAPMTTNLAPSIPLSLISTEQIQKCLDENKNLIIAILENQNLGKMAECAQYQAVLQKNLMYLAAIADAQPPGSGTPAQPQPGNDVVPPQGNTQTQIPIMQAGVHKGKLPIPLNITTPNRSQQAQQQHHQMQQAHFGLSNNNMHLLMQSGLGNSGMRASSGNGQGNSAKGPMERGNR